MLRALAPDEILPRVSIIRRTVWDQAPAGKRRVCFNTAFQVPREDGDRASCSKGQAGAQPVVHIVIIVGNLSARLASLRFERRLPPFDKRCPTSPSRRAFWSEQCLECPPAFQT